METTKTEKAKRQAGDQRLRDEVAMSAMAALINLGWGVDAAGEGCWKYADSFMAERERRAKHKE